MSAASHDINARGFAVSLNSSVEERRGVISVISNPKTTENGIAAQHVLALPSTQASLASLNVDFIRRRVLLPRWLLKGLTLACVTGSGKTARASTLYLSSSGVIRY